MKCNAYFAAALWLGLATAGSTGPALAAATDALPPTQGAAAQSRPDFSGHWMLNAEASDDPQEKLKEAMKAFQQANRGGMGRGGGMGGGMGRGGGMGGGMGGGRQGRGSPEAMGGRGEIPAGVTSSLMASAERLEIAHEDPQLLITDENEQRQRLFTDFRGASVSANGGLQQRVSVAGWEGATLVVETTAPGSPRLVQSYQIDAGTGQLVVVTATNLMERQPVSYRLVYDRIKSAAVGASQ